MSCYDIVVSNGFYNGVSYFTFALGVTQVSVLFGLVFWQYFTKRSAQYGSKNAEGMLMTPSYMWILMA